MILDILDNADRYKNLYKGFDLAFDFLTQSDLANMAPGRYEINGKQVYASISLDNGVRKEDTVLEVHRKYIDIQVVLEGCDNMGWSPKAACSQPKGKYDPASDIGFYNDTPNTWLAVRPGFFAIFFPEDAHMPLISDGKLRKVVVKVAV